MIPFSPTAFLTIPELLAAGHFNSQSSAPHFRLAKDMVEFYSYSYEVRHNLQYTQLVDRQLHSSQ